LPLFCFYLPDTTALQDVTVTNVMCISPGKAVLAISD